MLKSKPVIVIDLTQEGGAASLPLACGGDTPVVDLLVESEVGAVEDLVGEDVALSLADSTAAAIDFVSMMTEEDMTATLTLHHPLNAPIAAVEELFQSSAAEEDVEEDVQTTTSLPFSFSSSLEAIEGECRRLQHLAIEMGLVSESITKLAPGTNSSHLQKQLLDLSLQVLNIDAASLSVECVDAVVSTARSNYKRMARVMHPDKCNLDGAVDAFSGLGAAVSIISEHARSVDAIGSSEVGSIDIIMFTTDAAPTVAAAAAAPANHHIVWNQSRLVVTAFSLPDHLLSSFPHLISGNGAAQIGAGQLMFVPYENIPTFQRERDAGRRPAAAAVLSEKSDDVEMVVEEMLNALCGGGATAAYLDSIEIDGKEEKHDEDTDELVDGMLLLTCRAALNGRFPLNGTYFQINEVFADHVSAQQPVQVRGKCSSRSSSRIWSCGGSNGVMMPCWRKRGFFPPSSSSS